MVFLLDFEFVMLMGVWSECVFGGVVRASGLGGDSAAERAGRCIAT